MIEHALLSLLLNDKTISELVGDNIFYVRADEGIKPPYIVVYKVSGPREHSHDGSSHLAHPRFQFSVFAQTYLEAKQITQAIQNRLDGFIGESEGVLIESCLYINEVDMYEPDANLYHVPSDYEIYHKEVA